MKFQEDQYYDIHAGGELYCRMVLPSEFNTILPMARKRVSEEIEIVPVVVFLSGFDTYVTTKLV